MQPTSLDALPARSRVLVRIDCNVPIENGVIQDASRIDATLPTLAILKEKGCAIVIIGHLGSPHGQYDPKLSLKPVAEYLASKLNRLVHFYPYTQNLPVEQIHALPLGEVALVDNLRFWAAEEEPNADPSFAKTLSLLGHYFVNDAFACAHRAHSSIVPICGYFQGRVYFGQLMELESKALLDLYTHPRKPYLAILGGAKISSKIAVIESLLKQIDALMIGGGMSVPFLKALGHRLYSPLADEKSIQAAAEIIKAASERNIPLYLPVDLSVAPSIKESACLRTVSCVEGSLPKEYVVDIGPKTIAAFKEKLSDYQTIFWNGPMGVFEVEAFSRGTHELAMAIAQQKGYTVVGGGDSVYAIDQLGLKNRFDYVSTGGGACLEFLEKGTLPGIQAILQASAKP
jgi:phosphoglycerate kinase